MHVKKAGLPTKLLILALLIAVAISLLELNSGVKQALADKAALEKQVVAQTQTNAGLADAIEHSEDPERKADVARDKLGLVEPGEIIFYSAGD